MFVPPITRFLAKGPPKKCVIVTKLNSQPKCVNQVNTVIGKHASKLIFVGGTFESDSMSEGGTVKSNH